MLRNRGWVSGIRTARAVLASFVLVAPLACEQKQTNGAADAPTDKAPELPSIQGWLARFDIPGGRNVSVHLPSASFALAPGESVHPGVPSRALSVTLSAEVSVDQPGRYRFHLETEGGTGRATVYDRLAKVLGVAEGLPPSSATAWIDLPADPISLSVRFTRSADAPARLRILWEREGVGEHGFPPEPVPPGVTRIARFAAADAAAALQARHGRVLLGELRCIRCHDVPSSAESPFGGQFAFALPAPILNEVGARASPQWLRRWITNPHDIRPGTTMPDLFTDSPADTDQADAIVHYLTSLGGPATTEFSAPAPDALARGRRLFHTVGCVACHGPQESPEAVFGPDAPGSEDWQAWSPPHPFGDLRDKWRPPALAAFLHDPLAQRPDGRMPSLDLSKDESELIAAYLASRWNSQGATASAFSPDPARVRAGRSAFAARGCAACHEMGGDRAALLAQLNLQPLARLLPSAGCLDPRDTRSPRYDLSSDNRAALGAAIRAIGQSAPLSSPAPADFALRTLDALGCRHCHERDETGGVPDPIKPYFRITTDAALGDEGRLPPRLTGEGWKLKTAWLHEVLTNAGRARPYMETRMPQFGAAQVDDLARALAALDGVFAGADRAAPPPAADLVAAGHRLVGESAMNCISCHAFGDRPLAGTPGPDMVDLAERIRFEWWKAYVRNPQRFKPGTRMSSFYHTLDGLGQVKDVFAGDPDRQTDALWAYLKLGAAAPLPEGQPVGP